MVAPDFIVSVRWQDVVDILLNSYILFRLHILFRGTNTFRVLVAIAFLWFFQRITLSMGLIVTSWAFQGITAAAALLIIIVFRNEIRTVFQTQSWQALLWGFPKQTELLEEDLITEALFELAEKRIGAILVFPGREDLSELVYGGIPWDGDISAEMITSVFWPGNPVHDGAAVIAGRKITTVGGILPLTDRGDLPTNWGTRHRAAAGLAERTDALAVIVSEERGDVVAAKGASIEKVATPEKMKEILHAHQNVKRVAVKGIQSEAFKLVIAAFLSLVLVASAWISLSRGRDTLISLDVPIQYVNLNQGFDIADSSTTMARIQLIGFSAFINALRPDQVAVKIDLANAVPGKNTFQLGEEQVILPPGITLTEISPARVSMTLDVKITKAFPLQVDWVGTLPDHLILSSVYLEPPTLSVTARGDVLNNLTTIYTERVSLEAITESGQIKVKPDLPDMVRLAEDQKETVIVHYEIKRRDE